MTIHRFFVDSQLIEADQVFFNSEQSKQITKVLRLQKGDGVVVLDNSGYEYQVILEQISSSNTIGKIVSKVLNKTEPKSSVILYQALTTRDKMELILQKCTEIGISRFIPIETKRSLLKVKDFKVDKIHRFERIVKEAAEQSERGKIPQLSLPLTFEQALEQGTKEGLAIIAWEDEKDNMITSIKDKIGNANNVSIFVGPEGGFEKEEIETARKKGALIVSLGSRILRTETAAIVVSALICI